ncbi:leucine-rich repeat domain-containing protein [Clostridium sp. L2-50]|uniref:leucine-rich repeat domain-containing protein n=1 Tax=Clostridium sp. L2-50 TaxID=411489 RepID=UPI00015BE86A|nr:leucine-rich repeat domain-containing protein [Clostridium sp. L2-50]EDO57151.1 hypothetical protein CLOL250_02337 [Clostridium sp. L2-50]UEA74815.1 leucine-rich repeat domain-containing protein [Lachnospiraceae bacterium GAM79]UEA78009.1 leucine-rich repeat domain-containing protein [Lachnospiraceae bacterium GAM79]
MIQKKIRSLIYTGLYLVLCVLLCGGIGKTAQAAESKTYNGFMYEEKESEITITGYVGDKTEVVIPGEINGKKVTTIGDRAFNDCTGLTSVTIPEGVTSIGDDAFSLCVKLTSISLPKSLTSIGSWGFSATGLTSITIPENVRSIGCEAFYACKLKKVVLPEGITRISSRTFAMCSNLTDITIPDSVTSIDEGAFCGCDKLDSIVIPDSVIEIDVRKKGEPLNVNRWPAFSRGVTIICSKNSAAYKYAKDNNLPIKLLSGKENPSDDSKQNNITPAKKGTTLTVSSKKLKVKVTSSSKKNPTVTVTKITDKKAKKLTIPATVKVKGVTYKVTAISDKAFKGNKKLITVTIGSNVTKLGKEAFSGCKNLKKITVTTGKLKTISKNAFKGINKKATITVKGTKKAKTALKKQLKKKSVGYVKTWKIK